METLDAWCNRYEEKLEQNISESRDIDFVDTSCELESDAALDQATCDVSYQTLGNGTFAFGDISATTCEEAGLATIRTPDSCVDAADALGLSPDPTESIAVTSSKNWKFGFSVFF